MFGKTKETAFKRCMSDLCKYNDRHDGVCGGGGNHLIINKKQTTLRFYTIYKTVDPVFHFANYIVIVTSHLKGEDIKI